MAFEKTGKSITKYPESKLLNYMIRWFSAGNDFGTGQ